MVLVLMLPLSHLLQSLHAEFGGAWAAELVSAAFVWGRGLQVKMLGLNSAVNVIHWGDISGGQTYLKQPPCKGGRVAVNVHVLQGCLL